MTDFCTSTNDSQQLLSLLPPLPSIQRLVALIMQKVAEIKSKYTQKINDLTEKFTSSNTCLSPLEISRIIDIRNNIVTQLSKVYKSVDRISSSVTGISGAVNLALTLIKITSSVATSVAIGSMFIPLPIPGAVSSGISAGQNVVEKGKFKANGAQKLVPLQDGLISANVVIQLFASALKNFICQLEKLDLLLLGCIEESDDPVLESALKSKIEPLDPEVVAFVEETIQANESSLIETTYRGFEFEIEEVPFNPRVNRKRANALNKDKIVLLSSELSFTQDPSVLIEELKFAIDRDNLRAD